jgi:ABC-type amino acid transport substrate-binding protein
MVYMKNWSKSLLFISVALLISFCPQISSASREDILTKEEVFWLKSRNNTLIVYPEKNFPPFSYQDSAGNPQGLSIDYLKLIADKIGVKIGLKENVIIGKLIPAGTGLRAFRNVEITSPEGLDLEPEERAPELELISEFDS